MKFLLFCILPYFVLCTFYLVAFDPRTKQFGQAAASSGYVSGIASHWYQHRVKGKGMAGEQAYTLRGCSNVTKHIESGLSAPDVAKKVMAECYARNWNQWRLAVVTADGQIEGMIAKTGCHSGNPLCGKLNTTTPTPFLVMGGGLRPNVLEAAIAKWKTIDPALDLSCRLYIALKACFEAGAEIVPLRGVSLGVDGPNMATALYIRHQTTAGNPQLLEGLTRQLPAQCKTYLELKKN
jgi:uncharacterized Ntn-hydrolase superfamily protein